MEMDTLQGFHLFEDFVVAAQHSVDNCLGLHEQGTALLGVGARRAGRATALQRFATHCLVRETHSRSCAREQGGKAARELYRPNTKVYFDRSLTVRTKKNVLTEV